MRDNGNPRNVAALAEVLAENIGAELYQTLMEASADEWRRWEFMTDAAKEKYRREGARIVGATIAPALRDLLASERAKALREAAEGLDDHTNCDCDPDYGTHLKQLATPKWLRERADREESR